MDNETKIEESVEILQQMGLKEYEAKCFVALTRLPEGTAKRISEVSDVPRTRVYDAIRVLETKGLVEVQHKNPKVFRAIPIDEAVKNLRDRFESRTQNLSESLQNIESLSPEDKKQVEHEVWALSGGRSVSNRTYQLIDESENEIALVMRSEFIDDALVEGLGSASDRGVRVFLGTFDGELDEGILDRLPDVEFFSSDLGWLSRPSDYPGDETEISRVMLIDSETILVSTFREDEDTDEKAVFGRGFDNGFVTIVRRLVSRGMSS